MVELDRGKRDAEDAIAVQRLAAGDTTALHDLYRRYGSTALALSLKILRNSAEAEDVVHDAFVAVSERAKQFSPERGSVAAWLITTVRNLSLDRTRRRSRRAQITEEELRHEPKRAIEHPEALLSIDRERRQVVLALAKLPEAQRATLEIAFFEGLSYPEIAEREGVPLGTVKSRAARALNALRAILDAPAQAGD